MKKILVLLVALLTINVNANETPDSNVVSETVAEVQPMIKKGAESFEEAITPYITSMLSGIESGVDFAKDEIPIVIRQYLMFEGFYHGFYVILSLIMIFILRPSLIKLYTISKFKYDNYEDSDGTYRQNDYKLFNNSKYIRTHDNDVTFPQIMVYGGSFLSIVIGIIVFFCNIFDFIKVVFMPKLYLVEKFVTMVQ